MDNRTAHPARAWTARPAAGSSVDHRSPAELTRSGGTCGQVEDLPTMPHFACPTSWSFFKEKKRAAEKSSHDFCGPMVHTNARALAARGMDREDTGQFTETGSEGVYGKVA